MNLKPQIERVANIGVRSNYQPWEIFLTRKQNLITLLGVFNLIIAVVIFLLIDYPDMALEIGSCILISPFVLLLNHRFGYISASYAFAAVGYVVFFLLSVRLGEESLSVLYYFPLIIGLTQMLGRREMVSHLIMQLSICFVAIFLAVYFSRTGVFRSHNYGKNIEQIRMINIVFSIFTTMIFVIIITIESIGQEKQLKAAVKQKEILLAELFHRVKNNLNLVTSLLSLKKNTITSEDGKKALEECRDLVFTMAMIHTKVYSSGNMDKISFDEYIKELTGELIQSLSHGEKTTSDVNSDAVVLDVSQAIPCGLILNELITNSFKHGRMEGRALHIKIFLQAKENELELTFEDNGVGMKKEDKSKGTLGLELIQSLSDQLEGKMTIKDGPGFKFVLGFRRLN